MIDYNLCLHIEIFNSIDDEMVFIYISEMIISTFTLTTKNGSLDTKIKKIKLDT